MSSHESSQQVHVGHVPERPLGSNWTKRPRPCAGPCGHTFNALTITTAGRELCLACQINEGVLKQENPS